MAQAKARLVSVAQEGRRERDMSKYIIDIPDNVKKIVYFHLGNANAIWTTSNDLDDLEQLNSDYINENFGELQDQAYHKGLVEGNNIGYKNGVKDGQNEAWECAKKLFSTMSETEIEKVFPTEWNNGGFNALINLQPQEAIAKLKAYEEKQEADDKIEVGDEVNWIGDCFIVTRIFQPHNMKGQCDGIDDDGCTYHDVLMDDLEKTGRHYDIASILEDMRND